MARLIRNGTLLKAFLFRINEISMFFFFKLNIFCVFFSVLCISNLRIHAAETMKKIVKIEQFSRENDDTFLMID